MEKRLGTFPSTPEGAPTPALGERSGAPSGLRPSSFVMCNTPVEVQFTSAGCLNYPCRTPAVTAPERTAAQHQSLLHFVGEGNWSDERVLAKVRGLVLPEIERHGPIEAWIIDDTGFPKKGRHSVGVGRQYCGELGKQDNCQIAVTLSIANHHASLPVAYRLYLPKEWATDRARRSKAGVPKEVTFKTKPAIALEQLALGMCGRPAARGGADGCGLWHRY